MQHNFLLLNFRLTNEFKHKHQNEKHQTIYAKCFVAFSSMQIKEKEKKNTIMIDRWKSNWFSHISLFQ